LLLGRPLVLHEQNSVAGMANKVLAGVGRSRLQRLPAGDQARASGVGNPLREAFLRQAAPEQRFAGRTGPLKLLVVGRQPRRRGR
jgi:UDP-N-acetylglucosamine--N-acetylmuramyl-(pentapeptide) pyrophosphoryl-undecaprenol N-acetylglucosamine transferase